MGKSVYLPPVISITNKATWKTVQAGVGAFLKELGEDKIIKQQIFMTVLSSKPVTLE